ncbi:MAG TPA: isoprenylcysteine carboxylmethyltransferase family protein [Myxococcales bacterium]|nr:isoprenylcysteine carboxylmethyltransferase family protein [Myxococcales bacterium]
MHNASESAVRSRQGGARVRVPPPVWFALAIVVGALLPGLRLGIVASAPPGALLVVAAVALLLWSVRWFRRTGQDPKPWTPSPELIHRGPYRFSRNPMYVGMTVFTIGIAGVLARGWIALLAPLALLAVHRTAVLREEAYLSEKFGEPYREYMKRVRRYL